jgi:hypothetical protein
MDSIVQENCRKNFVLIDCLDDSGVAEVYTADEHKMAVSSPSKRQYLYCGTGKQNQLLKCKDVTVGNMENKHALGRQMEQFQQTGSVLHKDTGRSSADTDTVEMVCEASKCSTAIAHLQPSILFQQDGDPPHWGLTVRDSLNKTFPNRFGRTHQSLGLLALPI